MASGVISAALIEALQQKLGLGRTAVYARISRTATRLSVSNRVGALAVAQEAELPINRYASSEEIAELRAARGSQPQSHPQPPRTSQSAGSRRAPKQKSARRGTRSLKDVFVVHGRNEPIRNSMFDYLRALGLNPLEWSELLKATKKGAPYI